MDSEEKVPSVRGWFHDDATVEYRVHVSQKIEQGLEDMEAGNLLSEEEFDQRFAKWFLAALPDRPATL